MVHTWSTMYMYMYYIRPLISDIVNDILQFSHSFSAKGIGYSVLCIGAHWIWLRNCTNTVHIFTNILQRETMTKS